MPALMEAYKLSSRAAQVGFDWPDMDGLFEKLQEETAELQQGLKEFPAPGPRPHGRGVAGAGGQQVPEPLRQHLEEEVGDLFFVLVNIARYLVARSRVGAQKDKSKIQAPVSMDGRAVARLRPRSAAGIDDGAGVPVAAGEDSVEGKRSR